MPEVNRTQLPAAQRREIRVFISSTFRDMWEEREELVKQIFPQLRRLCESRGVVWGEVDLRWGVPDEAKSEGKVLPLCLQEIEHCQPYFIGLLGERYGWVPDQIPESLLDAQPWLRQHPHQSVTALEILHGVLLNPGMPKQAFFYFRDPAYAAARPGYTEEDSALRERLATLKDDIRRSGVPVAEPFTTPKQLGEWVLRDLTIAIERAYPETTGLGALDRAALDHEAYSASRRTVYVGRQEYLDRLDAHAASDGLPLVVAGESGGGKSALLANWSQRWSEQHPETPILVHFIGAAPDSAIWTAMLRRLLAEFQRKLGIQIEIPDRSDALRVAFASALLLVAARGRLVLVLDALNQIEDRDGAPDLVWLPPVIPANVRLIVSTLPGRPWDDIKRRGWPTLTVESLAVPEREELIHNYLKHFAKVLSPEPTRRIAAQPQSGNGLYLSTLLNELRQFGSHDRLEERIAWYLEATRPTELFSKVIERWEEDYGKPDATRPNVVRESLTRLWAARHGLSETELLESLGTSESPMLRADWSPIYLAAGDALLNRAGLLGFAHDSLRQAVRNRYLASEPAQRAAHVGLADYFQARELTSRRVAEEPWQLLQAGSMSQLAQLLANVNYAAAIFAMERHDLLKYWARIEEATQHRIAETYSSLIENPQAAREHIGWLGDILRVAGDDNSLLHLLKGQERLARSSPDPRELLDCLEGLAALKLNTMAIEEFATIEQLQASAAWQLLHEHEVLSDRMGDKARLQKGLGTQAQLFIYGAQYGRARELLERQLRLCEGMGDRRGSARALGNLAFVHCQLLEQSDAIVLLERAEDICRETGDALLLVAILDNHGQAYADLRRPYEAIALWQEEAQLAAELGVKGYLRVALSRLDQTYSYLGADAAALPLLAKEESLCRELHDEALGRTCEERRRAVAARLEDGQAAQPMMHDFRFYDDRARRSGIIAVLRTIADPEAQFVPATAVVRDIQVHIAKFIVADLLLHEACKDELDRIAADEYRRRWGSVCEVIVPFGDALHRSRAFLENVAGDQDFTQFLRQIGSQLLYKVFPALGFSQTESASTVLPLMRCALLLMGDLGRAPNDRL